MCQPPPLVVGSRPNANPSSSIAVCTRLQVGKEDFGILWERSVPRFGHEYLYIAQGHLREGPHPIQPSKSEWNETLQLEVLYPAACGRPAVLHGGPRRNQASRPRARPQVPGTADGGRQDPATLHAECGRSLSDGGGTWVHREHRDLQHWLKKGFLLQAGDAVDLWSPENPGGNLVEMHGNIQQVICLDCKLRAPILPKQERAFAAKQPAQCSACGSFQLRSSIVLYDDADSELITPGDAPPDLSDRSSPSLFHNGSFSPPCVPPDEVIDLIEEDLEPEGQVDVVLWIGISFEQSASLEYFRQVRQAVSKAGREGEVRHVIINPDEEAYFNVITACSNSHALQVMRIAATGSEARPSSLIAPRTRRRSDIADPLRPSALCCRRLHGWRTA